MVNIDLDQLEQFFVKNDVEQARTLLGDYLAQDLTSEQKAATYVSLAQLYMRIMTNLNERENELLNETLSNLQDVDKAETAASEGMDLATIRSKLSD